MAIIGELFHLTRLSQNLADHLENNVGHRGRPVITFDHLVTNVLVEILTQKLNINVISGRQYGRVCCSSCRGRRRTRRSRSRGWQWRWWRHGFRAFNRCSRLRKRTLGKEKRYNYVSMYISEEQATLKKPLIVADKIPEEEGSFCTICIQIREFAE